jgi:dolichol-phosphate mannosyltransferase
MDISVVVPIFGCSSSLIELHDRLCSSLDKVDVNYEIIFVNDASPDDAWKVIESLASIDERVKGINLSRNFGQHYAITAGLHYALGNWIVVMDGDLQDLPEEIPNLYSMALSGYDVVVGRRARRQDNYIKKTSSKVFFWVFEYLSGVNVDSRIGNFGVYSRKVINSVNSLKEQNRSFGAFVLWVGFKRTEINIEHGYRPHGKSSYTFGRRLSLAFDSLIAHSDKVLRLTVRFGFVMSLLSFLYVGWILVSYFLWATPVIGWTSIIASLCLSSGMIILTVGIVGLYIGKIFNEVKHRPLYVVDTTTF